MPGDYYSKLPASTRDSWWECIREICENMYLQGKIHALMLTTFEEGVEFGKKLAADRLVEFMISEPSEDKE